MRSRWTLLLALLITSCVEAPTPESTNDDAGGEGRGPEEGSPSQNDDAEVNATSDTTNDADLGTPDEKDDDVDPTDDDTSEDDDVPEQADDPTTTDDVGLDDDVASSPDDDLTEVGNEDPSVGDDDGTPLDDDITLAEDDVASANDASTDVTDDGTQTEGEAVDEFMGDAGALGFDASADSGPGKGSEPNADAGTVSDDAGPQASCNCDDRIACTMDVCDEANLSCSFVADDALCAAGELCKTSGGQPGCQLIECESDDDCQDESACNGAEVCDPSTNTCQSGSPIDCGDDEPCSVDGCQEGVNGPECVSVPPDRDRDGFLDAKCQPSGGSAGDDCNDEDSSISPKASETCDGTDQNCNGLADETFPTLGEECSGGQGECQTKGVIVCAGDKEVECSATLLPPGMEACNDADDDCDGQVDEGCDDDGDGYCDAALTSVGEPLVCVSGGNDCNDGFSGVHPGVTEVCNDLDDDCDDQVDEGCDDDGDEQCEVGMVVVGTPTTCALGVGDCNDALNTTYLGAPEICNGVSDDCDDLADEGCDDDNDDYCDQNLGFSGSPPTCGLGGGDCNDSSSSAKPGATEACNGFDDDCDGQTDEGCDDDGDDYCDFNFATVGTPAVCPGGGGDCNDNSPSYNPGIAELCDQADNDCNGVTDESCNKVFVTSTTQAPGSIGGLVQADQLCGTLASEAGLEGTFVAWVSSSSSSAASRLGSARGWVRTDGKPVADSVLDLAGGEMFYPIRLDEEGDDVGSGAVFTGTASNGTHSGSCSGLTTTSGNGTAGDASGGTSHWTQLSTPACSSSSRLYCFQTDFTQEAKVQPAPSASFKKAFLSNSTFASGSGLTGADALCNEEASAAGLAGEFKALLATSAASAASRFSGSHTWQRVDGTRLATNKTNFFAGSWLAPIAQRADGSYLGNTDVWTGTSDWNATGNQHCASWGSTSSNLDGRTGLSGLSSTLGWSEGTNLCDSTATRLYCLEE